MRFDVKLKNDTVGYVTVSENKNDIIINSECNYTSNDILRLFAKTNDKIINLGVLEPNSNNLMCLNRKIKRNILNNTTIYYLDDGTGKYIASSKQYRTNFNAGKEHEFAYLLTACTLEKVNNTWITYIKKAQNE